MTADFSKPLKELHFKVDERTIGLRVDAALAILLPHRSRTFFKDRARAGAIEINGRRARASTTLHETDNICLQVETSPSWVDPLTIEFEVIEERDDLIAINKRPGQLIHPVGPVQGGTLINGLHARHNDSGQSPHTRPRVVHRLDGDTTGVVIFAKGAEAAGFYGQLFETRKTTKIYLALLDGKLTETVECREPLGNDDNHPVHVRHCVRPDGKPAHSVFTPISSSDEATLTEIAIHTGRLHQIRLHAAHIGYPVAGDALYNPQDEDFDRWIKFSDPVTGLSRPPRQLLHAWSLTLESPKGEILTFKAPCPRDFKEWAPKAIKIVQ